MPDFGIPDLAVQLISSLVLSLASLYGTYRLFQFVRSMSASRARMDTAMLGAALADGNQRGPVALQVQRTQDPCMASIPKYPGATPLDSPFAYEAQIHAEGRDARYLCQGFWTPDPYASVVAFYQRTIPNWIKDPQFMAGKSGYRCREQTPDCVRTVEIRYDFPRTIINYSVLYSSNIAPI